MKHIATTPFVSLWLSLGLTRPSLRTSRAGFRSRSGTGFDKLLRGFVTGLVLCLAAATAPAQSYKVLHTFGTNVMGLNPHAPLVQGPDGALYGTTEGGGGANKGQVFKVNPDGTGYTVLKDFTGADGASPEAGLLLSGTTLYGTAANGGTNDNGTVFKLNTDGSGFLVLHIFAGSPMEGANPNASLVLSGTTLYGTAANGGRFGNGTVFKIDADGSGFAVLKHFIGNDGAYPNGALILSGTTIYGTSVQGGAYGNGTVFKINTDGSGYAVLKSFSGGNDGSGLYAGLLLSGTALFGTTAWGGPSGSGTVFKINTDGSDFAVIKDFTDYTQGANPAAALLLFGTALYGTTPNGGSSGNGTVFKVNTDGSVFAVLKDFTNSSDGASPNTALSLSGTTLYGTTSYGGNHGFGTVFKIETDGSGYGVVTHFAGGDGMNPFGSLALDGTTLYGTTGAGGGSGSGTLFRVNADGSGYAVLKDFTNSLEGINPNGSLVLSGTTLFGTAYGGSSWNGVVFKVNTDGSGYSVLKDFTNSIDGAHPQTGLSLSGTTLYGTTSDGGSNGSGAVFKINTDGTGFESLHSFSTTVWSGSGSRNADGAWPAAGLILSGTTLYGTTYWGGSGGYGTVFKVSTDGTGFAVLKHFTGTDGANPQGGVVLAGMTLCGTTSGGGSASYGTVFRVSTDGTGFAVLKHFTGSDGAAPQMDLLLSGTTLYGTASWGGIVGNGTVFQIETDGSAFAVLKHFTSSDGNYSRAGLVLSGTTLYGTTGNGGSLDSGVLFSLSLLPGAPQIQLQPQSQTVPLDSTVTLLVVASGIPAPAYQWFFIGNAMDGATNYSLQLTNIQGSQAGDYTVVVTNTYGSVTSLVATLTVEDPFINGWPSSAWLNAGGTVSFAVDAGGTPPLTFQWFRNGLTLLDGGNISGAQTSTLTLTNINGGDTGWFFCLVTNPLGSVTGPMDFLFVNDPFINSQPFDQFANAGETAQFGVDAGGTPPLSYQWFKEGVNLKDGGNISGAQTSTLTLSNLVSADAGGYSVVVSNAYGTVASVAAQLIVNLATMDSFNPVADGGVYCLAVQADGKILVGGNFTVLGGQVRNRIGRLNTDGTLDAAFDPGADNDVNSLAVQADGRILLGGWFGTLGGQTRNSLARLNANGTLDTIFNPGADGCVHALVVQPDGKILVGGEFSTLGGQVRSYLGRLNADGTLDTNFNCAADSTVNCIAIQADGRILVAGWFNTLAGQTRNYLGRLNVDGTLDTTFNPGAGYGVSSLAVLPDGKILVAGWFTTVGGQPCNHIARLNSDGTLDTSFNPAADGEVDSLAVQADGKVLAGGNFVTMNGQTRNNIGRLFADGSLDTTFTPWTDGGVLALAVQPDGKILSGGWFSMLAGHTRNNIGRLNNTEPATQELSFDGSTITWLRGGASPEAWRTTFEAITNGTDWSNLGDGIRVSGGWQLSGLSVPTSANIRARGLVAPDGRSSWFVEAMLGPPVIVGQPQNFTSDAGRMAQFNVVAEGTPPLICQWLKDGQALIDGGNISGAQTATLTLSNITAAHAGSYCVVITNTFGSITSLVATLTVIEPSIVTQPADQWVIVGYDARFTVGVGGTAPFTYQWRKDGAVLNGGTALSLIVTNAQMADAGGYDIVVSNVYGSVTSALATLTVESPALTGPVSIGGKVYVPVGTPEIVFVSFLNAEGGATLNSYSNLVQLRVSGSGESMATELNDTFYIYTDGGHSPATPFNDFSRYQLAVNSATIIGPTDPRYDAKNAVAFDVDANVEVQPPYVPAYSANHVYNFVINADLLPSGGLPAPLHFGVCDDMFSDNSNKFVILVQQLALAPPGPPIISQPVSQSLNAGGTALFNVIAAGTAPFSYQWLKDGTALTDAGNISGAQAATLTLSNVFGGDAGGYSVIVTNAYGSVTSIVATLTVEDPFINTQPAGQSVNAGQTALFSIGAGGTSPLSFQWFKGSVSLTDGGNISGAHTSTLTLNNVLGGDGGGYSVVISNAVGSVTSLVATLSVVGDPFVITQPVSQTIRPWQTATFSVVAGGTEPFSYQWRKGGAILPGRTSSSLTLSNAQAADTGRYDVVVSNGFGSTTSTVAVLTVNLPVAGDVDLSFDPGSTVNGSVYALAVQPDGKVLIGGDFTTVHGLMCGGLARLNADGTTDASFHSPWGTGRASSLGVQSDGRILVAGPGGIARFNSDGSPDNSFVTGPVWPIDSLVLQGDGKVLIGGGFTSVNGTGRGHVARLNADGTLDTSFLNGLAGADGEVQSLALQGDGSIVIAGDFTSVNGVTRSRVVRLNADGSLDGTFADSGVDALVCTVGLESDGKILIGGWFTNVSGVAQSKLARLNPDGSLDASFAPAIIGQPNWCYIYCLSLQSDSKVLIGGYFSSVNGVAHGTLARLNADGSLDSSFQGSANDCRAFALQSDGKILIGGWIAYVNCPVNGCGLGLARDGVARLNPDGSVDTAFGNGPAGPNGHLGSLAVQNDGKILIAGQFTAVNWVNRGAIARLNPDGSLDNSFFDWANNWVDCLALQRDGKILIGGYGVLARLNPNGLLDIAFAPRLLVGSGADWSPSVEAFALQADGRILIGGYFTSINGTARTNLARLSPDGTLDTSFLANVANPDNSPAVHCLGVQSDGRVLVGGYFTNVNGVARTNLARLNPDGSLDTSFLSGQAGPDASVSSIALQGDGKILIGGYFINVSGVTRSYLARLNPDGSLDSSFLNGLAGPDFPVSCITLQSDGKVLIGGDFGSVNARERFRVAQLNPDGSLDSSFAPVLGRGQFDQGVTASSLAVQTDGNILVGGSFSYVNGIPCRSIVRLLGRAYATPNILAPPETRTAEESSAICVTVGATGYPTPGYQWFFNGIAISDATNSSLQLADLQFAQSGAYTVVITNAAGAVTSAPATINVIVAVDRRSVPGITVTGETGSLLNVDYANSLSPAPNWTTLDSVTVTNTSQFFFDLTAPLPPQRFYRAWQSGTPGVVPSLSLPAMVPAITLTGSLGHSLRVDHINTIGPTDAWVTLDTVTLTNTSQLYFDVSAPGQPARLYRIVPVP